MSQEIASSVPEEVDEKCQTCNAVVPEADKYFCEDCCDLVCPDCRVGQGDIGGPEYWCPDCT